MIIIAHRSGPGVYPEQSIMSAREALKNGADIVEMDVRETKDGEVVICHDDDTGRMFGVEGDVKDFTLAQFMAMRHVSDRSFAPHTLEDVLSCGVKPLLLHCKQTEPAFMEKLCEIICRYGAQETTTFGIQAPQNAKIIREKAKGAKILAFMPSVNDLDAFGAMDIDYIRLWEDWITPERFARIKAAGKEVWIMSNNRDCGGCGYTTKEQIFTFEEMGAHGVLVNDIPWIMDVYGKEKAR